MKQKTLNKLYNIADVLDMAGGAASASYGAFENAKNEEAQQRALQLEGAKKETGKKIDALQKRAKYLEAEKKRTMGFFGKQGLPTEEKRRYDYEMKSIYKEINSLYNDLDLLEGKIPERSEKIEVPEKTPQTQKKEQKIPEPQGREIEVVEEDFKAPENKNKGRSLLSDILDYNKENRVPFVSDFVESIPTAPLTLLEGAGGILEVLGGKETGKKIKELMRAGKNKWNEKLGIDSDSLSAQLGNLAGEIMMPAGAITKVAKGASKIPSILKALGSGGLWAALESGKQDRDDEEDAALQIGQDALQGAVVGGALNKVGNLFSKVVGRGKTKKELDLIRKTANLTDAEDIKRASELMGKNATIGEIVDSAPAIDRLSRESWNKSRMEKVKYKIQDSARELSKTLDKGKKLELYKKIEVLAKNLKEKANQSYDDIKEQVFREGLLSKNQIRQFVNIAQEASNYFLKGLPGLKTGSVLTAKSLKNIKSKFVEFPDTEKAFKKFVINNERSIPVADDLLNFSRKVSKRLKNATADEREGLKIVRRKLDDLFKDLDPQGILKEADRNYAMGVGDIYNSNAFQNAFKTSKWENRRDAIPAISELFGKNSGENANIFNTLPVTLKKQVIGEFFEEALEKEQLNPYNAAVKTWRNLPDYIKKSKDKGVSSILQDLKILEQKRSNFSGLQKATDANIGSRKEVKRVTSAAQHLNPLRLLDVLFSGSSAARGSIYRNRTGQKKLNYYLNPKLFEEMLEKKRGNYGRRGARAYINLSQESEVEKE